MRVRRLLAALAWAGALVTATGAGLHAQPAPKVYQGLEVAVAGVERATNVSLSDCPPGANSQRGVIKPGDPMEFAVVKVDFRVTPAFTPGPLARPTLVDESGKTYNTAQSFADVGGTPAFSCAFAFRVPKGAKVSRFQIGTLAIDLTAPSP